MKTSKRQPVHRTILAIDIEGFGGAQRSNPIRLQMRDALYKLVQDALRAALGQLDLCAFSDLGDGMLVLVDPQVSKPRLVDPLVPELVSGLKQYNASAREEAHMRLRVALHAGEVVEDDQGYSSDDLILAFRLLDAKELRLKLADSHTELALIVSAPFYDAAVRHGYGAIDPDDYLQVDVKVKETSARAWIHIPGARSGGRTGPRARAHVPRGDGVRRLRSVQKLIELRDLPPTSLYISTGDVHNYRLYGLRSQDGVPLRSHVETALLLGRHAVMHCADPYRSQEVASLVDEYRDAVRDGSLLFLLSETVSDPRRHFRAYVNNKVRQFSASPYGQADVETFRIPDADKAMDRAIDILEASPFALKRGFSAGVTFSNAIRTDLNPAEPILLAEHYHGSIISNLHLTLRQILQLTRIGEDGTRARLLADDAAIGRLHSNLAALSGYESFSKQVLLSLMREEFGLDERLPFYDLVAARVSVVHLRATVGELGLMEVTHGRDLASPYYFGHLLAHFGVLADCPPQRQLGVDVVNELRSLPTWRLFASYHLRIMADLLARRASADPAPDPRSLYESSRLAKFFNDVKAVISSAWEA